MKKRIITCAVLILLAASTRHALAQGAGVTVIPPTQEVQLTKGQDSSGIIKVRNLTDATQTISVTAVDFIVQDTQGTPVFLTSGELTNRFAGASWIELPLKTATVEPKQESQIPYIVHTPANATAGGHYVSLVVKNVSSGPSSTVGAAVNIQVASLLSLVVAGPITEKATVNLFNVPAFQEYGPVHISALISNNGDVHIKPVGSVRVTNVFGKQTSIPLPEKNIFPDASKSYSLQFSDQLLIGPYTVKLVAFFGKNSLPLSAQAVVWIIPWKIVIVILLALVALVMGIMLVRKKESPVEISITPRPIEENQPLP